MDLAPTDPVPLSLTFTLSPATGLGLYLSAMLVIYVLLAPRLGRAGYAALRDLPAEPGARVPFYRRALRSQVIVVAAVVAVWILFGFPAIRWFPGRTWWVAPYAVVLVVASLIGTRRMIEGPERRLATARTMAPFSALLPRGTTERRYWAVLAVLIGISEEALYRAFLVLFLASVLGTGNVAILGVLSTALFGASHAYQGGKGVVVTTLLGAVFLMAYLAGGLLLAMALHAAIDLRLLAYPDDVIDRAYSLRRPPAGAG